jgi:hypothetical protein
LDPEFHHASKEHGIPALVGMLRREDRATEEQEPLVEVTGAASVFAAVMSIIVSMAFGIHTNLYAAVLLYGSLALVAPALWRRGALSGRA